MKAAEPTKMMLEAMKLFGVTEEKKVPGFLFALGLRRTCGRCAGSGHYSYNQVNGTTCFGCGGKQELAAKLTKEVLAEAKVKVEAGELEALRVMWRAKAAAKKEIAPLAAQARELGKFFGTFYTERGREHKDASYEEHQAMLTAFLVSPIYFAQGMSNTIVYGIRGLGMKVVTPEAGRMNVSSIEWDVKNGMRRDYVECVRELKELIAMLETLKAEWIAGGW